MTYDTYINQRIAEITRDNSMYGDHANPTRMVYSHRPTSGGVIPGNAPYDEIAVFGGRKPLTKMGRHLKDIGHFFKPLGKVIRPVRAALIDKAVEKIKGGRKPLTKMGRHLRDIGRFFKPLGKVIRPVREALINKAVDKIKGAGYRQGRVGSTEGRVGGASAWIQHVKAYQAQHGCSYKDALKGAKHTYRK